MKKLRRAFLSLRGESLAAVAVRFTAALVLVVPLAALASASPDEIGGDNFDGFDLTPCDSGLASDSSDASEYAAALDLCGEVTEQSRAPGLISAAFSLTSGSGTPSASSRSIRPHYGTGTTPRRGAALVLLSTGTAAGAEDIAPSFTAPQPGFNAGKSSALPSDWLLANSGLVPSGPACDPILTSTAYDPVMLKLRIRVPNNARSFSLDGNFFTADFPEWTCGSYDDLFVALLDSGFGAELNPVNKDIAAFQNLTTSVNLTLFNNGSFSQCTDGTIGCQSGHALSITTCSGTTQLAGTGMDAAASSADSCNRANAQAQAGGGTGWFVMRGNVVPGDIIELRLAIWDSGDSGYDSTIALDNFRWSYAPVAAGATPIP